MKCLLHLGLGEEEGKILPFSQTSHETCLHIMRQRKNQVNSKYSVIRLPPAIDPDTGYHKECYRRYTALPKRYKREEATGTSHDDTDPEVPLNENVISDGDDNCGSRTEATAFLNIDTDPDAFLNENVTKSISDDDEDCSSRTEATAFLNIDTDPEAFLNENVTKSISDDDDNCSSRTEATAFLNIDTDPEAFLNENLTKSISDDDDNCSSRTEATAFLNIDTDPEAVLNENVTKSISDDDDNSSSRTEATALLNIDTDPEAFFKENVTKSSSDDDGNSSGSCTASSSMQLLTSDRGFSDEMSCVQPGAREKTSVRDSFVQRCSTSQEHSSKNPGTRSTCDEDIPVNIKMKTLENCAICLRNRYKNKNKLPLMLCNSESYKEIIMDYAVQNKMFDLIADLQGLNNDIFCHQICLDGLRLKGLNKTTSATDAANNYSTRKIHKNAFQALCEIIEKSLIEKEDVISLEELLAEYTRLLVAYGDLIDNEYRPAKLKAKITCQFGERLSFVDSKGRCYAFKSTLDKSEILGRLTQVDTLYDIKKVAYAIRNEILGSPKQSLPVNNITTDDLMTGEATITNGLKTFFECLLNGPDNKDISDRKERRCLSLCQDAIFCTTDGRTKPAKHLQLGVVMKNITSSRKVIDVLNRLGHSVSYNVVEEIETEMAFAARENQTLTPAAMTLSPDLYTGVAWDNFDRYVETNTGKNTLHDTVGICYQNIKSNNIETASVIEASNTGTSASTSRKRRRTVPVLRQEIEPYRKKAKMMCKLDEVDDSNTNSTPESYNRAVLLDDIWISLLFTLKQKIPMWNGWNSLIVQDTLPQTLITYLPQINKSPTSNDVVLETMKNSIRIANECDQEYIIVTYDLAIAKIALTIQHLEKPRFDKLFIMTGPFHILMAFFKVMGKYIDESGANNILPETNLIAEGSLNSFVHGLHYNRCKHIHNIFSAALELLLYQKFCQTHEGIASELEMFYTNNVSQPSDIDPNNVDPVVRNAIEKYEEFLETVNQGLLGKTAQYWFGYIKMAKIYRRFARSIKTADVELFKVCVDEMTSLFFTFNHPNYARWLVRFHNNLVNMEKSHPGLTEYFENGALALRRTKKDFSRNAIDLTLEQTVNADAARRLTGVTCFTNSIAARQRWAETHFLRTMVTSKFLEDIGINNKDELQKDLNQSNMERSHREINEVIQKLNNTMNPFDDDKIETNYLFNISSGKSASSDTEQFLLNVFRNGQEAKDTFIRECTQDPTRFEKPIKRVKQNTFSQEREIKKKNKMTGEIQSLKMERDLFAKIIYLCIDHNVDLEMLFTYPLIPVPLSLSHYDGTKNSTQKSVLLRSLEEKCDNHIAPQKIDHYLIDGMFFLHTLGSPVNSFGDLAMQILRRACAQECQYIHLMFDNVQTPSIKDLERDTRASNTNRASEYSITGPEMKVPSKFLLALRNDNFKIALVDFLVNEWTKNYGDILREKTLYVSNKENCYTFKKSGQLDNLSVSRTLEPNLESMHLEADTRIPFQIYQTANASNNVVTRTNDTDILVILLGNLHNFDENLNLWMEVGLQSNNSLRYINVRQLHDILGVTLSKALPGFHAFTGCDYTAAFAHLGKKKPLRILENNHNAQEAFGTLGFKDEIDNEVIKSIEKFTCEMYGDKKSCEINETRLNKFLRTYKPQRGLIISRKRGIDGSSLPPCFSVLLNKMKRTNFICGMWNNVIRKSPQIDHPEENGWVLDDNKYLIDWFDGPQVPQSLQSILRHSSDTDDDSSREDLDFASDEDVLSDSE